MSTSAKLETLWDVTRMPKEVVLPKAAPIGAPLPLGFPVFGTQYSSTARCAVFAGGGGPGNTGVHNKIVAVAVAEDAAGVEVVAELRLGEDQVDSIDVCENNGQLACAVAGGVKLYILGAGRITAQSNEANDLPDADQPAQVVSFCPAGATLAVAGEEDEKVGVYEYPSLKRRLRIDTGIDGVRSLSMTTAKEEDKNTSQLLCVCGKKGTCTVWEVSGGDTASAVKELTVPGFTKCQFRSAGFVECEGEVRLLTSTNLTQGVGRKSRLEARLQLWNTTSWEAVAAISVFQECGLTAMAISRDGRMVGVGSSDGKLVAVSVGESSLKLICKAEPHNLAVTAVALASARLSREDPPTRESVDAKPSADHPPMLFSIALDQQLVSTPVVPGPSSYTTPMIVILVLLLLTLLYMYNSNSNT